MILQKTINLPILAICPKCGKTSYQNFKPIIKMLFSDKIGRCILPECSYEFSTEDYKRTLEKGIPFSIMEKAMLISPNQPLENQNGFLAYLVKKYGQFEMERVRKMYFLGRAKEKAATIFWQIDKLMNVIGGLIISIDPLTGEADQSSQKKVFMQDRLSYERDEHNHLYGEHLLKSYPEKKCVIVNDCRSAVICSIEYPEYLWLAITNHSQKNIERVKAFLPQAIWYADKF
ncbi:DUF6371 domain-containing protein [Pollutibacter soli]|uniref:DUF6371 domain-containing protein n=1 Tax=Pollutibacter soli TaxID=3034157 RepID=UPI0030135C8E